MLETEFNNIYVINLDRRADRLELVKAELVKAGINKYERFSAIDGKTLSHKYKFVPTDSMSDEQAMGHIGCTLSHFGVLNKAKLDGAEKYAVFEDDVEFHENFKSLFDEYYKDVPPDWDCILLGGSHVGGFDRITERVIRIYGSYTTHAMLINKTLYDKLTTVWQHAGSEVDVAIASLHKDNKCYAFNPPLAWQKGGFSDILGKYDDYKHLK